MVLCFTMRTGPTTGGLYLVWFHLGLGFVQTQTYQVSTLEWTSITSGLEETQYSEIPLNLEQAKRLVILIVYQFVYLKSINKVLVSCFFSF